MDELALFFPFWEDISQSERNELERAKREKSIKKGTTILSSSDECLGLMLIKSGQIRAFIISEEGKELTIYRLRDNDICLFSASCIMNSIAFSITLEAEKDSEVFIIPSDVYKRAMERSLPIASFTNDIMQQRFSSVMWLLDQILFKRMDSRIALFLLEEAKEEKSPTLSLTQDKIASHLGTAREVVTRILKYLAEMDAIKLSRGKIDIVDTAILKQIANEER